LTLTANIHTKKVLMHKGKSTELIYTPNMRARARTCVRACVCVCVCVYVCTQSVLEIDG